jgi:hypothetical protein
MLMGAKRTEEHLAGVFSLVWARNDPARISPRHGVQSHPLVNFTKGIEIVFTRRHSRALSKQ